MPPLAAEDAHHDEVAVLVVVEIGLLEPALRLEAHLLVKLQRGRVQPLHAYRHAVQAVVVEGEVEHQADGLGAVAPALHRGVGDDQREVGLPPGGEHAQKPRLAYDAAVGLRDGEPVRVRRPVGDAYAGPRLLQAQGLLKAALEHDPRLAEPAGKIGRVLLPLLAQDEPLASYLFFHTSAFPSRPPGGRKKPRKAQPCGVYGRGGHFRCHYKNSDPGRRIFKIVTEFDVIWLFLRFICIINNLRQRINIIFFSK